jgi:gliding motility-associated-like protein
LLPWPPKQTRINLAHKVFWFDFNTPNDVTKGIYPIPSCFLSTVRSYRMQSILFLFLLLSIAPIQAQLVVTPNGGAAALISSLTGRGLAVSNVVLNCDTGAYGTFSNGSTTNLGFNNGILLTNGNVHNAIGPNDSLLPATTAQPCNIIKDPDLMKIDSLAYYQTCILEFDIVPQCNTLTMRFVFGSGEYPTYVGSSFNDAFGFFITGPNPIGPAYLNQDVAVLPNGTPVSINSVNNGSSNTGPCVNCQYYVNNSGGSTIQYCGMTTVLTVSLAMVPCATYHFKIAIADAGDCNLDSGVFVDFVECSTAVNPVVTVTPSGCSCNGAAMVTGTQGVPPYGYQWVPSGSTLNSISNVCPGTYTCIVKDGSTCGSGDTVRVVVPSNNGITITSTHTNVTCHGGCNGTATTTPTSGATPFTYSWNPGGATTSTATGLCAGIDTCVVTDANGCTGKQGFVITEPGALSLTVADSVLICAGATAALKAVPGGGTPAYVINWSNAVTGTTDSVKPLVNTLYHITLTDSAGCTIKDSVKVVITPKPQASFTNGPGVCAPSTITFNNTTIGGTTYNWIFGDSAAHAGNTSTLTSPTHTYADSGYYAVTLIASTGGGCPDTIHVTNAVHVFGQPVSTLGLFANHVNELTPQVTFTDFTTNATNCILYFGDGDSIVGCNPGTLTHTYPDSGKYIAYVVSINSHGCRDTVRITVFIDPVTSLYVPNAFTPNGDNLNGVFRAYGVNVKNFELQIFDRWGQLFFDSKDILSGWDGTFNGHACQTDVYVWRITYKDLDRKPVNLIGRVTLLR